MNENDREFIDTLKMRLAANPMMVAKILPIVAESQLDFVKTVEIQRSCQASQAILDLINAIMNYKWFSRLSLAEKRNMMHRVIMYHFADPKAVANYAECEKKFFKKFSWGGK